MAILAMLTDSRLSETERRQAIDAVLQSQTFARSAQLRALLQYICDREISGHPEELTEYQIAINALGRAKDYNLSDDSAVRNRAYELRQRLEKFYQSEQPDSPIRIEIPRGSYLPSFIRQSPAAIVALAPLLPAAPPLVHLPKSPARRFSLWLLVPIALALLAGVWYFAARHAPVNILKQAWGPLANPNEELLVSVAINLHMIVRPHISAEQTRYPAPPELRENYGQIRPLLPGTPLYMQPAQFSVPFAEMIAITNICNLRQSFGGSCQILPESEAPITALRGRSAVLVGSGTNSQAATILLKNLRWTVDYTAGDEIAVLDHKTGEVIHGNNGRDQYGLLTVISGPSSNGAPARTLVLSGIGSASIQSAVEFFTSADQLKDVQARFAHDGFHSFPPVYQVLIRTVVSGNRPISYEFAAYHVGRL